jgi:hypothetical protein
MSSHVRTNARRAIAEILEAQPRFKGHVRQSRTRRIAAADLPEVLVYTGDETVEVAGVSHPRAMLRRCIVYVEVIERSLEGMPLDDSLDAHCVTVEQALSADVNLNRVVKDIILARTEFDFDGESETEIGVVRLQYDVTYVTAENNPVSMR